MKKIRTILLAVVLGLGLSATPILSGCSTAIFQTDPAGATLFTINATYESTVRTAGRLYISGQITEAELRAFRDEANKFHKAYTAIVTMNEERKLADGDSRLLDLKLAVDALEALMLSLAS